MTGLRDSIFNHKIRFRGFNQPWEKFRGSDLLIFFPTNSLSWENLEYASGTILNLHYGLIHQGLPQQINLTENKLPSIKNECLPVNYELCKEGDVVFADASEDTNDVGKVIEFIDCNEKLVVSGLHTIHGRDKLNRSIVGFKGYAFAAKSFRNQMRSLAQGTKVYSISIKNFHDCFISIPEKEEQQKIIKILTNISHQIADEKKILKAFKVQKQFLIQKMFI
ncbi:hypothetical protein CKK33_10625 [Mucilaginibacter sp. MD40]|nr:hypothetical protein CKK33_10625 [Mucilaginibacter sp. MD40]